MLTLLICFLVILHQMAQNCDAPLGDTRAHNIRVLNSERRAFGAPALQPTVSEFDIRFVTVAGEAIIEHTCHGNTIFSEMAQAVACKHLGDKVWLYFPHAISFIHEDRALPLDDTPYIKVLSDIGICESSCITVVIHEANQATKTCPMHVCKKPGCVCKSFGPHPFESNINCPCCMGNCDVCNGLEKECPMHHAAVSASSVESLTLKDISGHLEMWKESVEDDTEAEELYELAEALQLDESHEKEAVLRALCSKWGVAVRGDEQVNESRGTLATVRSEYLRRASIMQQLAEIAKRAYIKWRDKPGQPSKKRRAQQQDRTISPKTRKVRNQ